jgi:hypothetical protein
MSTTKAIIRSCEHFINDWSVVGMTNKITETHNLQQKSEENWLRST